MNQNQDQHNSFVSGSTGADPSSDQGNENLTVPLGVGDEMDGDIDGLDPLSGIEGGKRINAGAILLVVVVVVAAAGLYSMRTLTRASADINSDNEAESVIDEFMRVFSTDTATPGRSNNNRIDEDNPLIVLNETYTDRQVPLNDVHRNPFVLFEGQSRDVEIPKNTGNTESQRLAERIKVVRSAIMTSGNKLKLNSVLLGSQPLANISGQILTIDQEIEHERSDEFSLKVKEVGSDEVVIIGEDHEGLASVEIVLEIERNR